MTHQEEKDEATRHMNANLLRASQEELGDLWAEHKALVERHARLADRYADLAERHAELADKLVLMAENPLVEFDQGFLQAEQAREQDNG